VHTRAGRDLAQTIFFSHPAKPDVLVEEAAALLMNSPGGQKCCNRFGVCLTWFADVRPLELAFLSHAASTAAKGCAATHFEMVEGGVAAGVERCRRSRVRPLRPRAAIKLRDSSDELGHSGDPITGLEVSGVQSRASSSAFFEANSSSNKIPRSYSPASDSIAAMIAAGSAGAPGADWDVC
jgi:hypothetical protein